MYYRATGIDFISVYSLSAIRRLGSLNDFAMFEEIVVNVIFELLQCSVDVIETGSTEDGLKSVSETANDSSSVLDHSRHLLGY